jgi:hypothetical protein
MDIELLSWNGSFFSKTWAAGGVRAATPPKHHPILANSVRIYYGSLE